MRWKLTIEYDGRPYAGFQRQDNLPTIQGEIERAIEAFCGQFCRITVAGRTDSGVHAYAQVAHFDLNYQTKDGEARDINGSDLAKAINAHLIPQPIAILKAEKVSDDFHARFAAKLKTYRYKIICRAAPPTLMQGRCWWRKRSLDVKAMHEAAQHLKGQHDYTSFRASECQAKNPVRSVDAISVRETGTVFEQVIDIDVTGRSFLHHQVRNFAGTLSYVGQGKLAPNDVREILVAKDRTKAGPTAPPDGLYLMHIDYPDQTEK
jgi:tRNA pseudouridine38-40 synthase